MKKNSGVTLIELIMSVVLMGIVLTVISSNFIFIFSNTMTGMRRASFYMQSSYALEHMKNNCKLASSLSANSLFNLS